MDTVIFRDSDGRLKGIKPENIIATIDIKSEENNIILKHTFTEFATKEDRDELIEHIAKNNNLL